MALAEGYVDMARILLVFQAADKRKNETGRYSSSDLKIIQERQSATSRFMRQKGGSNRIQEAFLQPEGVA